MLIGQIITMISRNKRLIVLYTSDRPKFNLVKRNMIGIAKISSETGPIITKEPASMAHNVMGSSTSLVLLPETKSHTMTPIFNNNIGAQIAIYNTKPHSSDYIQQANCIKATYRTHYHYYIDSRFELPPEKCRQFGILAEANSCVPFKELRDNYNILAQTFTKGILENPAYHKNPNQARPDTILDFSKSSSEIQEKGIHGYDQKYSPTGNPVSNVILTNVTEIAFTKSMLRLENAHEMKHGLLDDNLKSVFSELLKNSVNIKKQADILAKNAHLFDPDLLPPLRVTENFNTELLKPELKEQIVKETAKNSFVSGLLYEKNVRVGKTAKDSKTILDAHQSLAELIEKYGI